MKGKPLTKIQILSLVQATGMLAYLGFMGTWDSEGWPRRAYVADIFVLFLAGCGITTGILYFFRGEVRPNAKPSVNHSRTAESRLDELERLKRRDMVTPEEYAAKRQEILKDL